MYSNHVIQMSLQVKYKYSYGKLYETLQKLSYRRDKGKAKYCGPLSVSERLSDHVITVTS